MNTKQKLDDDPVLALGELALDTDKNMFKMGDGATAWSELPHISMPEKFNDEDKLRHKLKRMLLLKYFNMLREELGRTVVPSDLTGPEPQEWRVWMSEHGIAYSRPKFEHLKTDLMGSIIYVPKDFADKALALGFMP
jgi:hypothetical protein